MKIIYNTIAVLFCILTLGFVDLNIKYSDKTQFKWVGWISRIIQGGDKVENIEKCTKVTTMKNFTIENKDDINSAIDGLGQFCHSFCMNCEETEKTNDLVFRCKECPFEDKETRKCRVKIFLNKYGTPEQIDRATCMGSL